MERLKQYIGIAILVVVVGVVGFQSYDEQVDDDLSWQVPFARGAEQGPGAAAVIEAVAAEAAERSDAIVVVTGHTGTRGDEGANLALSEGRAVAVRNALVAAGVPAERIVVIGVGSDAPLPRGEDETDRAYQLRLGRADILLTDEPAEDVLAQLTGAD